MYFAVPVDEMKRDGQFRASVCSCQFNNEQSRPRASLFSVESTAAPERHLLA